MRLPWLLLAAAPCVGSFLGVLIRRIPGGQDWMLARSACDHCGHPLGPAELVPLASFAAQRGRCRHCGAPIARFHPAIELAALAVCVWAILADPRAENLASDCVLGWGLLALAWIDAETFLLPDILTLPLLLLGLFEAFAQAPDLLLGRAAGALAGWFGLAALAALYRRVRGRDGIGGGDPKLLGVAGAWLGWLALPWVLLVAALLGLAWAGAKAARGARLDGATALPFGPPLALAIWLLRLYGGVIGL